MNKLKWILLLMLATSAVAETTDSDIQFQLESIYAQKLKQFYPNIPLTVSVVMKKSPKIELDLLVQSVAPVKEETVEFRVKEIQIRSTIELDVLQAAEWLGVKADKVKILKVNPPAAAPVEKPKEKVGFFSNLTAYVSEPAGAFQLMQSLLFSLFAVLFVWGIRVLSKVRQETRESTNHNKAMMEPMPIQRSNPSEGSQASPLIAHEYTDSQLKSMMAECYWTNHDREAAALIRAYPRVEVYQKLRFGADYIQYLKTSAPGALDFMKDAYFISPIPIFDELSVEDTPIEALTQASILRFRAKKVNAVKMISMQAESKGDFKLQAKLSALRNLDRKVRVRFESIEEESLVLQSDEISQDLKMTLPSFFVVSLLSEKDFQKLIEDISLNQLAAVWIGPDWLLKRLELKMNERKRALFSEIRQRILPSPDAREHPLFEKLLTEARKCLKPNSGQEDESLVA